MIYHQVMYKRKNNYTSSTYWNENYNWFGWYDSNHIYHRDEAKWRFGTQQQRRANKTTNRFYKKLYKNYRVGEKNSRKSLRRMYLKEITIDSTDEEIDEILTRYKNTEYVPFSWLDQCSGIVGSNPTSSI